MISLTVPLILASQSPRRSHLLRQIGLSFTVHPSAVAEVMQNHETNEENVRRLAYHKAVDVANQYRRGIVLGADTIVVIDGEILNKPETASEAEQMLSRLSGRTHSVYTGFALVDAATKLSYIDHEQTDVTFRNVSPQEIRDYVKSGSPMDKAGAYGIQDDFGAVFVRTINGCYYTVVGLPLSKLYTALDQFARELGYTGGES